MFKGKLINVRKEVVTTVSGKNAEREIVEHCDGVAIIAITNEGKMLMERQFRIALREVIFEVPAGKIDDGEYPGVAASRELREETGFRAEEVRCLTTTYPSVGYTDEKLYVYLCTGLTAGERDLDDGESIDVEEYTVEDLYEKVIHGEITDSKSQLAILLAHDLRQKKQI